MLKQLIVWAAIFIICMNANFVHTTQTTSPLSQENITMTSFTHGNISGRKRPIPMSDKRISGGTVLQPNSWPFLVIVYNYDVVLNQSYLCGGTVYNETYIITATHCVRSEKPSVIVFAGEHLFGETEGREQILTVSRIITHPGYNFFHDHDIALLELSSPLDLKTAYVTAIEINTDMSCPAPNDNFSTAGWGASTLGGEATKFPSEAVLSAMSSQDCNMIDDLTYRDNILNTTICVVDRKSGYSPCSGDSGGPLVCSCGGIKKLVGVASGVKECGSRLYPVLYARISCYIEWIQTGLVKYPCKSKNINILQSISGSNSLTLGNHFITLHLVLVCHFSVY